MGDSDDEYDRRRRDKFRRERSDYDRSREREDRRRDDWNDREWDRGRERRSRGEYRDYDRGRRERFSPPRHELSPPQKRMRRDWDDHGGDPYHAGYDMPYGGGGGGPSYGPPQPWGHPEIHVMQHHGIPIQARLGNMHDLEMGPPPPVMKTFKEFLLSLDDSVDETEAVKRYNEYKLEFRRQQMQDFFLAHKDEEWFRSKYHPDEVGKRKQESHSALRNRLNVFTYLMDNTWFEAISLDIDKANNIIKTLDAAVIKMEGGTDYDLKILDQEEEEDKSDKLELLKKEDGRVLDNERKTADKEEKKEDHKKADSGEGSEEKLKKSSDEEGEKGGPKEETEKETKKASKKRNRKRSGDDSYDEDEGSASESESESESGQVAEEKEEPGNLSLPRITSSSLTLMLMCVCVFQLCKRYPGFMRVALSDPQPERRFFRRGWVTFDRSVNIKEICWNLQNIRVSGTVSSVVVARRLLSALVTMVYVNVFKQAIVTHCKLNIEFINDSLTSTNDLLLSLLFSPPLLKTLPSQNPILKNITDYLIEEVSAEEEELLGNSSDAAEEGPKEGNPAEINVERDEKLVKVLDRLLLYLRIVHSLDYYNTCEYPNEDEMPNRCGIVHVRGPMPPNRITHGEVAEWQKTFEDKLTPLFSVRETLSEDEAQKMGKKDPEQEVEKFVTANTQELGKDKWLCPLSGKKFKVRRNSQSLPFPKFSGGVTEDSATALPAAPPPGCETRSLKIVMMSFSGMSPALPYPHQSPQGLMGYGQPRPPVLGYGVFVLFFLLLGAPPYPPNPYGGRGNYDSFRGQGGYPGKPRNRMARGDPRAIVEYRDLDAPEDVDFF
uniref:Serrate, RNA effector molecule n=1 Tax=Latimeria chalumnae TaxID=7897 RepID=H2ZUZ4_LATCH